MGKPTADYLSRSGINVRTKHPKWPPLLADTALAKTQNIPHIAFFQHAGNHWESVGIIA